MGADKGMAKKTAACLATALLAACSSTPRQSAPVVVSTGSKPATSPAISGQPSPYSCSYNPPAGARGNFYKDDGPLELPGTLEFVPEPLPRTEPLHRWANNPYTVLGQKFIPLKTPGEWTERGIGSWYGRKFHGQKTSSGETYDMFGMTAAHPTLPIPSYARVTHLKNGRSVVVRINDRGPFLKGRIIDLSFLAACRLGYAGNGSAELEVVSLLPGEKTPASAAISSSAPSTAITAPAEPVLQAAVPARPGSVFLQLGAFSSRSNAESFHAHLARELDEAQANRLAIQEAGTIYRVRLGPFPDRATALAMAEKLTGQKNLPAVIAR
ncbi:rare lipoprotein A [Formivibrio citricus]|uniref:Endolytic peptidoglycan transglycosylase RlpA n=2 Tax=Formivibrio citricus TaxID=83765 RepID=A0A1I5D3D7_9NEIS|nr:rare lipoprotein A [Formivibrio citricus]